MRTLSLLLTKFTGRNPSLNQSVKPGIASIFLRKGLSKSFPKRLQPNDFFKYFHHSALLLVVCTLFYSTPTFNSPVWETWETTPSVPDGNDLITKYPISAKGGLLPPVLVELHQSCQCTSAHLWSSFSLLTRKLA